MKGYLIGLLTNYLGLLITILIQVLLLPFLLNSLGPKMTGLYYLFITVSNFVAVGINWLTGAGVYLLASKEAGSRDAPGADVQELHWAVFAGCACYSLLILAVVLGWGAMAGRWWLTAESPEVVRQAGGACAALGFYILVFYVHQADIALLMATLRLGWANFYRVLSQLIFAGVVIVFITPAPRLDALMLANLIGVLLAAVAARLHLRWSGLLGPVKWRLPRKDLLKEMILTRGAGYFIFGIAQYGLIYGDVLIIGAVLGPEIVTAYLIIWKIPEVAALLLGRISEILSPYLTRIHGGAGTAKTRALFLCTSRVQHCLAATAGLAYGWRGAEMVALWVGRENRPEDPWLYWLAGSVLIIQAVNRHDIVLHYALAKLGRLVKAQFAELALKIPFMLLLFPRLDVAAPLVAALVIQLAGLTWFYRGAALQLVAVPWRRWVFEVAVWPCAVLVAAGATAYGLSLWAPGPGVWSFILSLAAFLVAAFSTIALIERYKRRDGLFHLHTIMREA